MIGLSGLLLTSATGAKIQLTPMARASRAVSAASANTPSRSCGGGESHVVRPRGGGVYAHGRAALEIGADQEGKLGHLLHAVQERGHGVGLGIADAVVHGMAGDDESADVEVADVMLIPPGIRGSTMSGLAVDRHDDELGGLLAQSHGAHPSADGGVTGGRGLLGNFGNGGGGCEECTEGERADSAGRKVHPSLL